MPTILSFVVNIEKNPLIFFPGQTIVGTVTLILTKSIKLKAVKVQMYGGASTHVRYKDGNQTKVVYKEEKFMDKTLILFGPEQRENEQYPVMPEGRYDYKFSFELPKSKLPSSYEGINGNYIRYFVEASIHVPWKKYEPKARKAVTILELVDCNKIEFMGPPEELDNEVVLCCWCCTTGPIKLTGRINKKAVCPGEDLQVLKVEIDNSSSRTLHDIKIDFKQIITQKASSHKHVDEKSYFKKSFDEVIEPHRKLMFENVMVHVPCIAPTNTSSKILKVEYVLRVYVRIPMEPSLAINFPVIVGTIPTRIKAGLPSNVTSTVGPSVSKSSSREFGPSQLYNAVTPSPAKPTSTGKEANANKEPSVPAYQTYRSVTEDSCIYCAAGYAQLSSDAHSQPSAIASNDSLHDTIRGHFEGDVSGIPPPTYEPCVDGKIDIKGSDGDYVGDTFFTPLYPVFHSVT